MSVSIVSLTLADDDVVIAMDASASPTTASDKHQRQPSDVS